MQGATTLVQAMRACVASAVCLADTITWFCRAWSSHLAATFLGRKEERERKGGRKEEREEGGKGGRRKGRKEGGKGGRRRGREGATQHVNMANSKLIRSSVGAPGIGDKSTSCSGDSLCHGNQSLLGPRVHLCVSS